MKFSEKLQALRKESKLSQEALADMLDVSRQAVSKWESGQTYPEMDKLLALTKIFKCTLDDLTNDEVSEFTSTKRKNNIIGFIDDILSIINKSSKMFKTMTFKEKIKIFFNMVITIAVLLVFLIPIDYLSGIGRNVFYSMGNRPGEILSSIWSFILVMAYLIAFIFLLLYIYKANYLDLFDETKYVNTKKENEIVEEVVKKSDKAIEKEEKVKVSSERVPNAFDAIFSVLGKIFTLFIKMVLLVTIFPFIGTFIFLFMLFAVSIGLIFKGVFFVSVFLIIIGAILINYMIVEIIFSSIFTKKVVLKRSFILLISSIILLGMGSGILMLDISEFKYYETMPSNTERGFKEETFQMNDKLMIDYYFSDTTTFIQDDTLKDSIKITASYFVEFADVDIRKNGEMIEIYRNYYDSKFANKIVGILINDIKNKDVRNYSSAYNTEIIVYGSKKNLELIVERYRVYYENLRITNLEEEIQNLNTTINEYQTKIYELEEKINILEYGEDEKIMEYQKRITECNLKIEEYKEKIKSLMEY